MSQNYNNIYRVNLINGENDLFLTNVLNPLDFTCDSYQSLFFLLNRFGISIYQPENPTVIESVIPDSNYDIGISVILAPSHNFLYLSWQDELTEYLIYQWTFNTSIFNSQTLSLIKKSRISINPLAFLSSDENFIYQPDVDPGGEKIITKYSIVSDSIVDFWYLKDIYNSESIYYDYGHEGKVLLSYNELGQNNTPKYFVYDLENNQYYPSISFHYRSYGYLSPNTEYIILQKALWDTTKQSAVDFNGEISVYKTLTGELISNLTLPPKGKILFFNSYPNKFFYYVPETEQAITIDLTELEQNPISNYSIFATNSIWLQQYSNIISGSVGVNQIGETPFLTSQVELAVGKGTTTPVGYALKGNRIEIKQNTTVNADVYYNELTNNGTITGSLNTPLELPLIAALPEFQSSTPGTEDIVVQQNEERILLHGAYRDIQVKNNAKLIFTGGEYHINNFNGGESNQLLFQADCEVRIKEKFETGKGSYIGPQDTVRFSAKDIVFYIEGNNGSMGSTLSAAGVGEDSRVKANFYVPNGTLWLRKNSEAEGAFIGKNVKVGEGTKVKLKSAW